MRRIEEAKRMLDMAFKDIKALEGMHDVETFDETIFGFHAQQAIEKAIKSWLTYLNKEYPKTHDISLLLNLLEEQGMDCSDLLDLVEFNAFAVQFRYEAFDLTEEILNRQETICRVRKLLSHVKQLITGTE